MYRKKSRGSKILATTGRGSGDFVKFYLAPQNACCPSNAPPPKFRDLAPPLKPYICSCDKIAFGTNKHLPILKVKISGDAKLFFLDDTTYGQRKWSLYISRHFKLLISCDTNYSKITAPYWSIIYSKRALEKWIIMWLSHISGQIGINAT